MKNFLVSIALITTVISIWALVGTGCANIIPPSGGPKDSLPPVLLNASPKDSTLNFKSNRITLTFDEYIDLQEVQNNLLFTPIFETVPVVEARLKTITIRLRDSLEANTTYTFNFGNAIKDINEGIPLSNFSYTFSTGPYLDSLELRGRVLLAESGKVDSTLTVVLHTHFTDSAVVNQRPRYATRLDSSGNFIFRNLPRDTFAIYAIGEAGIMRRYLSVEQLFAFSDSAVISGAASPITLYAYKEEKAPVTPKASPRNAADKRLRINTNLDGDRQDLLKDFVIAFESPLRVFDSTKISFSTDSSFTPVTAYSISFDTARRQMTLRNRWKESTLYNLILDKDFAEDTLGRKIARTDTVSFTTKKSADYGNLRIRVRNIDTAQNPVLLFIQSDKVVFSTPIKSGLFTQPLFIPGEYGLRILYDSNNNGKWDPGSFFGAKRQPEFVRPITRTITIKANWDNEFEVNP